MKVSTLKPGILAILILLFTFLTVTESKAVVDVTPPTGTILINNGAVAVNTTAVTLNLSATDDSGTVSQMRFSNDNANWSAWENYATTKAWTLTAGNGNKFVYVQFKDASGNMSASVYDIINLDQVNPTGSVSINGGASAAKSTAVVLNLSATDNTGVVWQMRFSSDNVTWTGWSAYAATKTWTLAAGEGTRTVYAQFSDRAGNVSTTASDTIVLDQTLPTGTISINNGATATNSTAVTLTLTASDNSGTVTQMRFSSDNVSWSGWSAYAPTKAWTFAAGEGVKRAYVQFNDAAGNLSTIVSDTITLDQTLPTGTISIDGGNSATGSVVVTLTLSATDNSGAVSQMRFSNDNVNWGVWSAYGINVGWMLSAGSGVKTVYAQFKDAAGNVSTAVSDATTLDQTLPTGTISIDAGAATTNSTAVTLTLSATDDYTAVRYMRFSNNNADWVNMWDDYATTKAWTLTSGDGVKTVYVQFLDLAGNTSTSISDTIRLDQTAPTGTVSINAGATAVNSTAVTLNLSATDNSGAVSQMRFSNDNVNWSAWSAYAATKAWTLIAGEGTKTVYAQFKDAAGNASITASDAIRLDQTLPTGTISINSGATSSNSTSVTLTLSATDDSGAVVGMRLSNDNVSWSSVGYAASRVWTLPAGEGIKTVYVQFVDAAGNVSTTASDAITLDQTLPAGTISINTGAPSTNLLAATLTLSATDNSGTVSQMRVSTDNATWSVFSYTATKAWTLAAGDGIKTVYVQFKDAAGNWSISASDTITLDQTGPAGTVSVNGGASATNSTAATLTLSATDNSGAVSQMRFSNDNYAWSLWSAYATSQAWTLAAGNGIRTVYAQFKDAAGNVSTTTSDAIRLDQTSPTGTISINSGATTSSSTVVTLTLSATDDSGAVVGMRLSNDNVSWSSVGYAASRSWTLPAGEGIKTVYVQFVDAAGNVSTTASDAITLDQTQPAGTISINNGAAATNLANVTLNLSATDNSGAVSQMRFSNDNVTWGGWVAYSATRPWPLPAGEGVKTVYVQFKDAAGNASTTASDAIRLDQTGPAGSVSINAGASATNSTSVTLTLSATDNSGAASQMRLSSDSVTWSAWSAYTPTKAWTLVAGNGIRTVYAQFKDAAGNVSTVATDTITLDTSVPTGTVSINNGTATTKLTAATLTLSAADNSGTVSQMRFSSDSVTWTAWENYVTTKAWTLGAGDGVKTVYAQFKDAVGNVSIVVSDTIRLDLTAPTGTISINSGAVATKLTAATLTLSAVDNSGTVSQVRFSNDSVNWSPWSAYAPTAGWTLAAGNGIRTVYAQFKDAAGNASTLASDTIRLDTIAPTGTIRVNNGAAATKLTSATLALSAVDNSGTVAQMRFSSDSVTWTAWENYATTKAWTLAAGDGVKTVYVQFVDAAGNASTTASDTITLDQTLPTGTITINSGAAYTNSTAATLTLSAADNNGTISQMRFKDDTAVWTAWENYAPTKAWTLTAGEGVKTVYVQFTDASGNASTAVTDTIRLDQTAPTGTVSINNGAVATNSTNSTLTLSAVDNGGVLTYMRFSNDNLNWSAWENYASTKAWTLTPGEGVKTVYVQFNDEAGNWSTIVSDTISLDQMMPSGTVSINGGAALTNVINVTLTFTATDNSGSVAQMRLSNDNVNWSAWSLYASTKAWTLTAGDGMKDVFVQFKDAAGNVSAAAIDSIRVDQMLPTGDIWINSGAPATRSTAVTLNLSSYDNSGPVAQMRFSSDNSVWTPWENSVATKAWTLSAGEGIKSVYVQFKDAVGNVSTSVSDTIRLDTTPPSGVITINFGAASTDTASVTLTLSATDNSGSVYQMRFSNDHITWIPWSAYSTINSWMLTQGAGTKTVYVQFIDEAGNVSATSSDTINLVTVASVSGRVVRNNGSGVPNVVVSINTTPTPTTATTDAYGNYTLSNILSGSYQLTPGITGVNGAIFSPATKSVTVGANSLFNEDFKARVTYSVSGTVNYAGARTGRIYLSTNNDIGTSISSPGAFTIRGVEQGPFTINAYMDHVGDGRAHATSPSGSAVVTVGGSNVSGVSITLTDPAPYVPAAPQIVSVSPSNGGAFIIWNPPYDSNGKDASDRVNIYYSTSPSVSPTNGTRIGPITPTSDNLMYLQRGIANGTVLYYVMTSEAGANRSGPSNVVGPVTINPNSGSNTVSGTVTASGFTPTGSLIVGLYNEATNRFYYTTIASPAVSQPYSVTGVPNGTYFFATIYDMNNNSSFDSGDQNNFDANETVTVASSQTRNTTVTVSDIKGKVTTDHYKDGAYENYSLKFDFDRGQKNPVKIAVVSGPNMAGPLDLGKSGWGGFFKYYDNLVNTPLVGDTYTMNVTYSDGTTANITRAVTGVVNSFSMPLSPSGPVPGSIMPQFVWSAPSPAVPNAAGYRISVNDANWNNVWWSDQIPMSALSAQFNFDGRANVPVLTPGTTYRWSMRIEDQFGNEGSSVNLNFTP